MLIHLHFKTQAEENISYCFFFQLEYWIETAHQYMMDIKQSEEYKHNGSDMKKTESRADAFQRNEEHATYCYFRTVMLVMPFVTMVSICSLHQAHMLFNDIIFLRTDLVVIITI